MKRVLRKSPFVDSFIKIHNDADKQKTARSWYYFGEENLSLESTSEKWKGCTKRSSKSCESSWVIVCKLPILKDKNQLEKHRLESLVGESPMVMFVGW